MTTLTHAKDTPHTKDETAFLREVLSHVRGRAVIARIQLPAPSVSFSTLLRTTEAPELARHGRAGLWRAPRGPSYFAAWGSTACLRPSTSDNFRTLQHQAHALFRRTENFFSHGRGPSAQVFGGFAFSDTDSSWAGFGAGRFDLPRWEVRVQEGQTWVCLNLDVANEYDLDEVTREYSALQRMLLPSPQVKGRGPSLLQHVEHLDRETWDQMVEQARAAISEGSLHKVVLARRSTVRTTDRLDPRDVLAKLDAAFGDCFLFSLQSENSPQHFLGASPERLVSLQGHRFFADALAGSVDPARPDAENWLQESAKDRREHAFVVDEIVDRVRLLCAELTVPGQPTLRRLKNVLHLHTPIEGRLKSRLHVLELLSLLHPTPAVCGVPAEAAREWIEAHESHPRGWYAGPVGWFDAQGQGEFAVALRSGRISAHVAELYAGAGIVRDSDPENEYQETAAKLGAMLSALGFHESA